MSHNITNIDAQQGIEQAWHGMTDVREVIEIGNPANPNWLETWDAVPTPLYYLDGDSYVSSGRNILRDSATGATLGHAYSPETYSLVSNADFLALVRDSIAGGNGKITSIGSVCGKTKTFVSVKMDGLEPYTVGEREFRPLLNLGNGHGKTCQLWQNTSSVCVVCDNTFSWNLASVATGERKASNGDVSLRQKHTKNLIVRLPDIAQTVNRAIRGHQEFANDFANWLDTGISVSDAEKLFTGFLTPDADFIRLAGGQRNYRSTRGSNQVNRLLELFGDIDRGNSGENLADAFSAVTDYYSHESAGDGKTWKQLVSSEFGSGQNRKSEFHALLKKPATVAKTIEKGAEILKVPIGKTNA